MNALKSPVIIVGAHKSGTSAIAGILNALGVNMGKQLLEADAFNIYGHFEDVDLLKMNDKILKVAEGTWHHPPSRLKIRHAASLLKDEISQLLEEKIAESDNSNWGWKDPRNSLTLSVWLSLLSPDTKVIVCRRSLEKTTESLLRRDGNNEGYNCTPEYARLLTDYYNDEINSTLFSLSPERYLQINYEDLLKNTDKSVRDIVSFLGMDAKDRTIRKAVRTIRGRN